MPAPRKGEGEDDYVQRCIPVVIRDGTAEDGTQAAAICHSMWRNAKKMEDAGELPTSFELLNRARLDLAVEKACSERGSEERRGRKKKEKADSLMMNPHAGFMGTVEAKPLDERRGLEVNLLKANPATQRGAMTGGLPSLEETKLPPNLKPGQTRRSPDLDAIDAKSLPRAPKEGDELTHGIKKRNYGEMEDAIPKLKQP